jgi:hypothetical protein
MDHYHSDFHVRYHANSLSENSDEINTLMHKLSPTNLNPADAHLSIEEKYAARTLLQKVLIDIALLQDEATSPTGPTTPKKIFWRFYYRK